MKKYHKCLLILTMICLVVACSGGEQSEAPAEKREQNKPAPKPINNTKKIPSFNWPPPKPSAFSVIKRDSLALASSASKIGHLEKLLRKALDSGGYYDVSYYRIESQPDAFLMATRLEKINANATSAEGKERWITNTKESADFSLTDYIKVLFYAKPGKYRIILFVVSAEPINFDKQSVNSEKAKSWISDGSSSLTRDIKNYRITPEHQVTALIYEFEKNSSNENSQQSEEAVLILPSSFQTRTHLEKSGIWKGLTKK